MDKKRIIIHKKGPLRNPDPIKGDPVGHSVIAPE